MISTDRALRVVGSDLNIRDVLREGVVASNSSVGPGSWPRKSVEGQRCSCCLKMQLLGCILAFALAHLDLPGQLICSVGFLSTLLPRIEFSEAHHLYRKPYRRALSG